MERDERAEHDAAISKVFTPREEVLERKLQGIIGLYDVDNRERLEGSPDKFLKITRLTDVLRRIIDYLDIALKEGGNTAFFLVGGFGTGKTHSLVTLYHILGSPRIANSWLGEKGFDLSIPSNSRAGWVSGTSDQPNYLWEPLLKRLGEKAMTRRTPDGASKPPSRDDIVKLVEEMPTAMLIDEIEDWYGGLEGETKRKNRDFLRNLTEIATDERYNLFLFVTFLDKDYELKQILEERAKPITIDLDVDVSWTEVIRHRLFKDEPDERLVEETAEKYSNLSSEASFDEVKESYPFHPEVIELLREVYGPEGQRQGVRNPLRELANAIVNHYEDLDLILVSDLDYNLSDPRNLLPGINRPLARKWWEDLKRCSGIEGAEPVLKVLYAYSLLTRPGATKEQIIQGVARTGKDEALIPLEKILESHEAYHVTEEDDRFLITEEPTIPKMVSYRARRIDEEEVKEKISSVLKTDVFRGGVYLMGDSITDTDEFKVIISPKSMDDKEIEEYYQEFRYQNLLTVVLPKAGESAYEQEVKEKAKRVLASEKLAKERDVNLEELEEEKSRDMNDLESMLKEKYGRACRFTEENKLRKTDVETSVSDIKEKLKATGPEVRYKIRELADKRMEAKRILDDFRKLKSYPIVLKEEEFIAALKEEFDEGSIGLYDGNVFYHKSEKEFPFTQRVLASIVKPGNEVLEIIKKPEFTIRSFNLPEKVREGEDFEVTATIENVGEKEGEDEARLLIDGKEYSSETIALEAREGREVKFPLKLTGRRREVSLEVTSKRKAKRILIEPEEGFKEAFFTVCRGVEIHNEEVKGGKASVSFEIVNIGGRRGEKEISLSFSGTTVDSKVLTLDRGESRPIKLSGELSRAGDIEVSLKIGEEIVKTESLRVRPKEVFREVETEGKAPFEIQELQENDDILSFKVDLQRGEVVDKRTVQSTLSSLPEGTPVKVKFKVRRKED